MVRTAAPSRGCRVCRQRRIKCDESVPTCKQCRRSGRECTGPITGVMISDMTAKLRYGAPSSIVRHFPQVIKYQVAASPPTENKHSKWFTSDGGRDSTGDPERLGASLDPFGSLQIKLSPSTRRLVHHCIHVMPKSLVPLGPGDPMRDAWLPMIFSDPILLEQAIYTAAIHMSALYGMKTNPDIAIHKAETLSLLNRRLSNPLNGINDTTLCVVIGFIGQVIASMNVQETKIHMDGLAQMLSIKSSFEPSDQVKEVLFWTDLVGSALCHTPLRNYENRPNIRLYCHPIFLDPGSTPAASCRGFQDLLATSGDFSSVTNILHDLRCLIAVFHFSGCTANTEIPLFVEMCLDIRDQLESLPLDCAELFESCRLAVIMFVNIVLLNDPSNSTALLETMQSSLQTLDLDQARLQVPDLLLWIFFMGNMATMGTGFGQGFLVHFLSTAKMRRLHNYEAMKRVLAEFLWVDVICDEHLQLIWTETSCELPRRSSVD